MPANELDFVLTIIWVAVGYSILKVVLIAALICWHIWLSYQGITTFQHLNEISQYRALKKDLQAKKITKEEYDDKVSKVKQARGKQVLEIKKSKVITQIKDNSPCREVSDIKLSPKRLENSVSKFSPRRNDTAGLRIDS